MYEIEVESFGAEAYDPALLQLYMGLARDTFLVALLDGRVVGYAIAVVNRWGEGHLISVATHPRFRRRGVASALLQELLRRLRGKGARVVRLEVRTGNSAAISLYRKFGFRIVGTVKNYYPDGEDAYLMLTVLRDEGP